MARRLLHFVALCALSSTALAAAAAKESSTAAAATSKAAAPPAAAPAAASPSITPLSQRHFTYPNLPYKVDTDATGRGPQAGYTMCNSTTENQESMCQVAMINSLDDFCLWGPAPPNETIGDIEAAAVAWCTKPGRGTRLIPRGALTAVQFMRTSAYVQVTGLINQQFINMQADDGGGELDPHGDDERGNPLGSLVFSNGFAASNGNNNTYIQVEEWHNFMGSDTFCFKACDPAGAHAADFCQHIFDRIGCKYNAPAAYAPGVFEHCDGDVQDFPGIYTDSAGTVHTYTQPPESLGPISTIPYTPRIPASSNCVQFQSAALYANLPSASGAVATTTPSFSGVGVPHATGGSSPTTGASTNGTSTSGATTSVTGLVSASTMLISAALGAAMLALVL